MRAFVLVFLLVSCSPRPMADRTTNELDEAEQMTPRGSVEITKLPEDPAAKGGDAVLKWLVGLLSAVNVWQLLQMYAQNREAGIMNTRIANIEAQLLRMSSDTESEKDTRARVNKAILQHLKYTDEEIDHMLSEAAAKPT